MTVEQRKELLKKFEDTDPKLVPYLERVMDSMHGTDNIDELEGIANELWEACAVNGEQISVETAVERWVQYETSFTEGEEGEIVIQHPEDEQPEVKVDEAMTRAALENRFRDMWTDKILSGDPEALDQFGKVTDEKLVGKFRGLVPNEKKTGILKKMNRLADIVSMTNGVTVPEGSGILNSESNNSVVMLDFCNNVFMPAGESLKALHKLMSMADDFCISDRGGNVRMSFGLHEMWKEYRELQPWEIDEEN